MHIDRVLYLCFDDPFANIFQKTHVAVFVLDSKWPTREADGDSSINEIAADDNLTCDVTGVPGGSAVPSASPLHQHGS